MTKVIEFYVRDLFPKKAKSVLRDRCGEVIEFPKDKAAVAGNTPKIPERDEGNPFAALGLEAFMRSATGEERHFSALGWNHAGGDGRTSAHNPRLLAAQQPSCHEQIPAGNIEDQALGTGQIGRRYFADGYFAEDKPNPMSAVWNRSRMGPFSFGAYRPLTSPDLLDVRVASA